MKRPVNFFKKIKESRWNKRLIKNDILDQFLNGIFWSIVICGIIGLVLFSINCFYNIS